MAVGLSGLHLVSWEKTKHNTTKKKNRTCGYKRSVGAGVWHLVPPSFPLAHWLKKSETPNCLPAANICCFQSTAREHQTCKKLINNNAGN